MDAKLKRQTEKLRKLEARMASLSVGATQSENQPQNQGGACPDEPELRDQRNSFMSKPSPKREGGEDGGPSPNFVQEDGKVWDQQYLSKALLQLKESDIAKLRFSETCYKPYEYEKWIRSVTRSLISSHSELGKYWNRVVKSAETVYQKYLNDFSTTRVSLKPTDK